MLSLVNTLVVAVLGVSVALVPRLSRPDVPLGVSIPSSRVNDPTVLSAVRRFEIVLVAATIVTVALALVLSPHAVMLALLMPLLLLVVAAVAWVVCRQPIQRTKAEQGWYDDVPVALVASATPSRVSSMWWGYLAAAIALVATGVVGALRWDRLPSPYPTHFGSSGHADAFAVKSFWTVFGPMVIIAVVVPGIAVLQWATLRHGARRYADGTADAGARRARTLTRLTQWVLNISVLLVALVVAAISLSVYFGASPATTSAVALGSVIIVLIGVLVCLIVAMRTLRAHPRQSGDGPDAPDDDAHWKGGLVYVNRDDPAAFVPKRTGIGFTVNFGSSAGQAMTAGFVFFVALIIVVTIVFAGH